MIKGRVAVSRQADGESGGDASSVLTYTIQDLEHLERDPPRFTLGQFGTRLLCMAYLAEGVPEGVIDLCTHCMQLAVGEKPCPHGTFPQDTRERPLLLWREDLVAAVKEILMELMAGSHPGPVGGSTSEDEHPDDDCSHGNQYSVCSRCCPSPSSVSSVSSLSASSAGTVSAADVSMRTGNTSGRIDLHRRTGTEDSADPGEGPSQETASQSFRAIGSSSWGIIRETVMGATRSGGFALRPTPPTAPSAAQLDTPAAQLDTHVVQLNAPAVPLDMPAVPLDTHIAQLDPPGPPAYVAARIDPYNPAVRNWYVVTVGRSVGVFAEWETAKAATSRLRGNVHCSFRTYDEAVARFQAAVTNGQVSIRQ